MKWFRHSTSFHYNDRLGSSIKEELGIPGIGRFWVLLEIIGANMELDNSDPILVTTLKDICGKLGTNKRGIWEFLGLLLKLDAITVEAYRPLIDIVPEEYREHFKNLGPTKKGAPKSIKHQMIIKCPYIKVYADRNSVSSAKRRSYSGAPIVDNKREDNKKIKEIIPEIEPDNKISETLNEASDNTLAKDKIGDNKRLGSSLIDKTFTVDDIPF